MAALPCRRETVEITPALARSGGVTIPIGSIAPVHVAISCHLLATLAVLLTAAAVAGGLGSGSGPVLTGLAAAAAPCVRIGGRRRTFRVAVATSGGTTGTFADMRRSDFANEIKSALETAISERGQGETTWQLQRARSRRSSVPSWTCSSRARCRPS